MVSASKIILRIYLKTDKFRNETVIKNSFWNSKINQYFMKIVSFKFLLSLLVVIAVVAGWMTFGVGASSNFVYVDEDASGTEDGSSSHPFKKIQDGIDEAKDDHKDVYVRKGEYEENLKLWKGVELHGSDRDKVKIKADDDDDPVIKMYDNTEIHNLTLKDGQYGVKVKGGAKAYISDCRIIDNDDDGIFAEAADTRNDEKLEIYNSIIAYNGWDGIYMEQRKFSVKNNEIYDNDKDGVEFEKGSEGVFEGNRVKNNDGVGLRLTIDKSELYIKNNTFRDNDKSGLEVRAEGKEGLISLNRKNKFYQNDQYGIVRVLQSSFGADQWNRSLKIDGGVRYWDNDWGNVSHIIKVY